MPDPSQDPPQYTIHRSRRRLFGNRQPDRSPLEELRGDPPGAPPGRRRSRLRGRWTGRRIAAAIAIVLVAWIGISLVLFLISAQVEQGKVSSEAEAQLSGAGFPLTSANTVLVLGSDARPKGSKEPGAGGPSRSDSIMLMRTGGGHAARLSILRDTVVDIPGHGPDKINAAYAIGGPALAIKTIKTWLGVPIDHVVEINFERFPDLIDAMGGITYSGGCVVSKINGGTANGGYTLRLRKGTHHLDGKQALALARTRHNLCNPAEDDRTRAAHQQKIFAAMKSRLTSPAAFLRLPWISWNAPKTLRSDMSGPTLIGLFGALAIGGSPPTRVLAPTGVETTASGGAGLVVSDAARRRAVRRFLNG